MSRARRRRQASRLAVRAGLLVRLVAYDLAVGVALEALLALHVRVARPLVVLDALVVAGGRAGRAGSPSVPVAPAVSAWRWSNSAAASSGSASGILLRRLDVALARLTVLVVRGRRALARKRVLTAGLCGLRVGLRTRLVRLRASNLRLAADLTCLARDACRACARGLLVATNHSSASSISAPTTIAMIAPVLISSFLPSWGLGARTRLGGRYAYFLPAFSSSSSSTSSRFSTLPVALRGSSSMNSNSRGTLKLARFFFT